MKSIIMPAFLAIFFFYFLFPLTAWELILNKNGVKVWVRPVAGQKSKEFKTSTVVRARMSSLLAILDDTDTYYRWMQPKAKHKVLKTLNVLERYSYSIIDVPWPLDKRDAIIYSKVTYNKENKSITILLLDASTHIPENPNYVRVKQIKGVWRFTPIGDGKIIVYHQFFSNPGVSLPAWAVNFSIKDVPYETLLKIKEMVKEDKYKNANMEHVKKIFQADFD